MAALPAESKPLPATAPDAFDSGMFVPTEEALRAHNESQLENAAAAAAAVLARLPVMPPSFDECASHDGQALSPEASEDGEQPPYARAGGHVQRTPDALRRVRSTEQMLRV